MGKLPNRKKRRKFSKSNSNSKRFSEWSEKIRKSNQIGKMLHEQHQLDVDQKMVNDEAEKNDKMKKSFLEFYKNSDKAAEEFNNNIRKSAERFDKRTKKGL